MFDEIAKELQAAREKSSMTLVQVANKSKIDLKFLEAMEKGDFAFLPDLYVTAFIKNFAKTVGLDENIIYKKYDAAKKGIPYVEEKSEFREIINQASSKQKSQPAQSDLKKQNQETKEETRNKRSFFTFDAVGYTHNSQEPQQDVSKRNLIITGSLLGSILLFSIVYFLFLNNGDQIIVEEKPIEDVISQNQRYLADESPDGGITAEENLSDSLLLAINASDTSWIKVAIDELKPEEFILLPNSQKSIKAKNKYEIILGNSGAVKLLLNNKPLTFTGRTKTSLNVYIDKDGIKIPDKISIRR